MQLDRKDMLNILKKVIPGVETGNSILEGADTFLFTDEGIYSYNDSIAVFIPEPTGLKGAVKSKDFYTLLQKLKGDIIKVVLKTDHIVLKCDAVSAKIKMVDSSILDYVENLNIGELKWKKLDADFMQALALCKLNISNSPFRGIYVEKDLMFSTDEIRIASHTLGNKYDKFWLDDFIVNELLKIPGTFTKISVVKGWVHFQSKDGSIFSCKTNDASLYPLDELLRRKIDIAKQKGDPSGKLPDTFKEAVDRVSVLAEDLSGFSVINLTFTAQDLIVSSHKQTGSIKERIDWEEELDIKEDISTSGDAGFLMEAVNKSFDFYITNRDDSYFIVFTKDKFTLILSTIK